MARHILVADAGELIRWSVVERLRAEGHDVSEAADPEQTIERVEAGIDVVLLDYQMPGGDAAGVLKRINQLDADVSVIMAIGDQDAPVAASLMKAGAFDCVMKPFDLDDVLVRVDRALETTRLRRELRTLRDVASRGFAPDAIVGESEPMLRLKALVRKVATSPGSTVLITGEPGVGKDLVARVIHYAGARAEHPFLRVRCAGVAEFDLESEMFGRELGAVADAPEHTRGAFELAGEGTVFLDEVAELTPAAQAHLLRVLEERAFRRLGGTADIPVDVRVVAATSLNLEERVREGRFRDDLYYRLNVLRVEVPPLRARGGDIARLARQFAGAFSSELMRPLPRLSPAAEALLGAYPWPGNVRELRNLIERAVLLAGREMLDARDFETLHAGESAASDAQGAFSLPVGGVQLEDVERHLVTQALRQAGGNQTRAAALLGLHRDQIRYRIEKFGLVRKS
jgi:two-component system response regulator AtoC